MNKITLKMAIRYLSVAILNLSNCKKLFLCDSTSQINNIYPFVTRKVFRMGSSITSFENNEHDMVSKQRELENEKFMRRSLRGSC